MGEGHMIEQSDLEMHSWKSTMFKEVAILRVKKKQGGHRILDQAYAGAS